jgi:hypothetical protein
LADIHDRMPLVLPRPVWRAWLDPDSPDVGALLTALDEELVAALELRPISNAVNKVGNNGPRNLPTGARSISIDRRRAHRGIARSYTCVLLKLMLAFYQEILPREYKSARVVPRESIPCWVVDSMRLEDYAACGSELAQNP